MNSCGADGKWNELPSEAPPNMAASSMTASSCSSEEIPPHFNREVSTVKTDSYKTAARKKNLNIEIKVKARACQMLYHIRRKDIPIVLWIIASIRMLGTRCKVYIYFTPLCRLYIASGLAFRPMPN